MRPFHPLPPDVYTSRVSNFMTYTPYAYFRWGAGRQGCAGGRLRLRLRLRGASWGW